jgi:hypothetical protein
MRALWPRVGSVGFTSVKSSLSFVLASALVGSMPLAVVGCAGSGSNEPDPTMPPPGQNILIPITVNNNWSPRASATVRLISGGVTRILGSVRGDQERTFQVDTPALTGEHRLSATGTGLQQDLLSQPFQLFANSSVEWTFVGNALLVGQRLGEPMQPKNLEP